MFCDINGRLLEKGDLIRFDGIYPHWGVYDGSGYVIHVPEDPLSMWVQVK